MQQLGVPKFMLVVVGALHTQHAKHVNYRGLRASPQENWCQEIEFRCIFSGFSGFSG